LARFRQKMLLFPFVLTFSKTVRSCSTLNCVSRTVCVSSHLFSFRVFPSILFSCLPNYSLFVSFHLFSNPVTCLVTSCSMAKFELLSKDGALPSGPSQSRRHSIQVTPPIRLQRPSATRPRRSGFKSQKSVHPNSSPQKEPIAIWIRSL
jgi:hypothetical protein